MWLETSSIVAAVRGLPSTNGHNDDVLPEEQCRRGGRMLARDDPSHWGNSKLCKHLGCIGVAVTSRGDVSRTVVAIGWLLGIE